MTAAGVPGLILPAGTSPRNSRALLLGSGLSAVDARTLDLDGTLLVVINNAFRVRDDWDVAVLPGDFEGERPVPSERQVVVSSFGADGYETACRRMVGSVEEAGKTMFFCASYWLLAHARRLSLSSIGFLGCDFDYRPDARGRTHFYGTGRDIERGVPDPVRMLDATCAEGFDAALPRLLDQLSDLAKRLGVELVNHSKNPRSRLPFEVRPFVAPVRAWGY